MSRRTLTPTRKANLTTRTDVVVKPAERPDKLLVALHDDPHARANAFVDKFYASSMSSYGPYPRSEAPSCVPRGRRRRWAMLAARDNARLGIFHRPNQSFRRTRRILANPVAIKSANPRRPCTSFIQ